MTQVSVPVIVPPLTIAPETKTTCARDVFPVAGVTASVVAPEPPVEVAMSLGLLTPVVALHVPLIEGVIPPASLRK